MKAILEFNLPEEQEEYQQCVDGGSAHVALWEISQQIFRAARKHGYSNPKAAELINAIPDGKGEELVGVLEEMFFEIINNYNVRLP